MLGHAGPSWAMLGHKNDFFAQKNPKKDFLDFFRFFLAQHGPAWPSVGQHFFGVLGQRFQKLTLCF